MYIIFSDINGTIYGDKISSLQKETKNDILRTNNITDLEFIITTSNGWFGDVKELSNLFNSKYVITDEGSFIYDCQKNEILQSTFIDNDSLSKIIKISNENKLLSFGWGINKFYATNPKDKILKKIIDLHLNSLDVNSEEFNQDSNVLSLVIAFEKGDADLYIEKLNDIDNIKATKVNNGQIIISSKKTSKGSAAKFMLNKLNTDESKMMSIGDSFADISMLEMTDFSYSMANSIKRVKEVAKLNTSAFDQNGVGMAITDFIFRLKIN